MSVVQPLPKRRKKTAFRSAIIMAVVAICVAWTLLSVWNSIAAVGASVGAGVIEALWILPALIALHLTQLLLAGLAWRSLFADTQRDCSRPAVATFYCLRVIREGIDSLLPVLQMGGEFVGAQLLSRSGIAPNRAAASIIVDVTIELLTQIMFLFLGLAALASLSRLAAWGVWSEAALAAVLAASGLMLAQRFGLLAALETLLRRIAARWPSLSGASLAGLNDSALAFYRQKPAVARSTGLHLLAWIMGTAETWMVLHALGIPVTPAQALAVESLGMAARSAGFAVPGALGVQEGGFVLAAMAVGLPAVPALSLSMIKRIREIAVGLVGVALWRWQARRQAA